MPDKQRVERFIDAVVHGDHVEAIRDFYHEDATMQENLGEPRQGRDTLMAHEAKALSNMQKMETKPVATFLVDGDNVAIRWTFIMTDKAGTRRQLEEVSLQRWDGDRIASEQFFYDSKTAWQEAVD
ncbi:nuclear transport factor 2 family protein [Pyruvatibacter sp.]|uniref:nuclear transport factor 2 family protein n=1 Tax=Pyruvatibacter sp. TaxID=1981328 RepID=UPI003267BAD8